MSHPTPSPPPRPAADLAAARALVDAQRIAIRHPNPRVVMALSQRVDRALRHELAPADLANGIALRDAIVDLAGLVRVELDRLRMELVHHLGTGKDALARPRDVDRVVGQP